MKKTCSLLLVMAMLVCLFAGCSGSSDSALQARAFGSDQTLLLDVKAEVNSGDFVSYGGYQFETGKKLDAMQKLVTKKNEGISSAVFENDYGPCWLFSKEDGSVTHYWCLYQKEPQNIKNWYIFVGAHRELRLDGENYDLLLPLHLISDSYVRDNMANRLELDTAYACGLKDAEDSMEALFYSFYASSGLYTITASDNGFLLTSRQAGAQQLEFSFNETDSGNWFTISVPAPAEPEPSAVASVTAHWAEEDTVIELREADALTLSTMLIGLKAGSDTDEPSLEPAYTITVDGVDYNADLTWDSTDYVWEGYIWLQDGCAKLSVQEACLVAGVFGANKVFEATQTAAEWPADLDAELTPFGSCMVVSATSLNVRSFPSTSGDVLFSLPQSSLVAISGTTSNGWTEIVVGDGVYAYVSAEYLVGSTTEV